MVMTGLAGNCSEPQLCGSPIRKPLPVTPPRPRAGAVSNVSPELPPTVRPGDDAIGFTQAIRRCAEDRDELDRRRCRYVARMGYRTSIGTSDTDTIRLLGHDLAGELLGQIGFAELAFWLVAQRRPARGGLRLFEAVLVAFTDHGFPPTVIAARLTYTSAPEAL